MIPWPYFLILRRPRMMRENLHKLHAAGLVDAVPTPFQVLTGVLYMAYRIVFRSGTVGVAAELPIRATRRARLLSYRLLRLPFVLASGVVYPIDLTGFGTTPDVLRRHLIGTIHPGDNAVYDLTLLAVHPGELEAVRADTAAVLDGTHPRGGWYRDLVVHDGYHEHLLEVVDRCLAGDFSADGGVDSDATVRGYVRWLCANPATVADAVRQRRLAVAPEA